MDDKTSRLAREAGKHPNLQNLAQSREAQELMRMLKQDGGDLQSAVRSAQQGDVTEITRRIRDVMHTPGGAALIARLQAMAGENK